MPRRKGKDRKCCRNDIVPSISLELYAMFSIDTIIKGNFVVFFVWFFTALLIDIISFCRLASTPAMFNSTLTEGEQFLCPADGSIMITGNMKCTFLSNCIYLVNLAFKIIRQLKILSHNVVYSLYLPEMN